MSGFTVGRLIDAHCCIPTMMAAQTAHFLKLKGTQEGRKGISRKVNERPSTIFRPRRSQHFAGISPPQVELFDET